MTKVNSKNVAKVATVKALNGLTPARKAGLPTLRSNAFASGVSRGVLVASLLSVCGTTPNDELFAAATMAIRVGGMAAALRNKGDNRDDMVLFAHCLSSIEGRQTKGEKHVAMSEGDAAAYSSAKAKLSTLCKDAGVQSPSLNAKPVATRAPGGKPAKAAKTETKATAPKVPTITNDNDLRTYIKTQRVAMLAVLAQASQGKNVLNATSTAIQDACAILAKLTVKA